jgi:hypothetical protein
LRQPCAFSIQSNASSSSDFIFPPFGLGLWAVLPVEVDQVVYKLVVAVINTMLLLQLSLDCFDVAADG